MKYLFFGGASRGVSSIWQSSFFEGHQGQVYDNLSNGDRSHIGGAARFILGDLRDSLMVDRVIKDFLPEVIVFNPPKLTSAFEQYEAEEIGLFNILKAMRKYQVTQLIFSADETSDVASYSYRDRLMLLAVSDSNAFQLKSASFSNSVLKQQSLAEVIQQLAIIRKSE